MKHVAALFIDRHSAYKLIPGVDCWDARRDATRWPGGVPFVAHPNCRTWATLSRFSTADRNELALALICLAWALTGPAIIEHPRASRLWRWTKRFPRFQHLDVLGAEWGGKTPKPTRLALAGVTPRALLSPPHPGRAAPTVLSNLHTYDWHRWGTPPALAKAIIHDLRA